MRQTKDIADLLFLTQSWSIWVLDHHQLKENIVLPRFEAALGVSAGTLTMSTAQRPSSIDATTSTKGKDTVAYGEDEEDTISFLLHRVYAYASATHKNPEAYDAMTLENLLIALAQILVPHLTKQVGLLASMRDMCLGSSSKKKEKDIPEPLPLPMTKITKTTKTSSSPGGIASSMAPLSPPSASPPTSPSSSTFSTTSVPTSTSSSSSSPAHSPPTVSLSLFPSAAIARPPPPLHHRKTSSSISSSHNKNSNSSKAYVNSGNDSDDDGGKNVNKDHPGAKNLETIDREAKDRLARARALLEADERANKLTQIYAAAEAKAATSIDHFVIPPMIVRLRDATMAMHIPSPSSFSLSNHSRRGSRSMGVSTGMGGNSNVGGGNKGDWPRFSVPAIHAIADKLSARHEGAWRFLPCDVWGRPRELPFLGD